MSPLKWMEGAALQLEVLGKFFIQLPVSLNARQVLAWKKIPPRSASVPALLP